MLSCVQGPPGTGKSTTIAELVGGVISSGLRCIAAAPSNKAIQSLARRVLQVCAVPEYRLAMIVSNPMAGRVPKELQVLFVGIVRNMARSR